MLRGPRIVRNFDDSSSLSLRMTGRWFDRKVDSWWLQSILSNSLNGTSQDKQWFSKSWMADNPDKVT